MVLVQKWPFFQLFFIVNLGQENIFYDIIEQKNAFLGYKNNKFKKFKNSHFGKGVNPWLSWFWSKNGRFSYFFFSPIQAKKMSLTIFQSEKTPFQAIKTTSLKSSKIVIFAKWFTHGFGPKMAIFPTFSFQPIKAKKISFTILQNKKTPFQAIKTTRLKSSKIDIFAKGLTHGFALKMVTFPTLFFQSIQAKKMSFTIFQNEKTPLQAMKTTSLKSSKIDIFAKGLTHGFGPKMAIFPTFVFRQFRPRKCLLRYSRTRKRLSSL